MIDVPYIAATTGDSFWQFDPGQSRVFLTVRRHRYAFRVCSERRAHPAAYALRRLDAVTWRVAPSYYVMRLDGSIADRAGPFTPEDDDGSAPELAEFVHLTHAPEAISLELEAL